MQKFPAEFQNCHGPVTRETLVQALGWEDSLEKGKVTHPHILAWRIPWIV